MLCDYSEELSELLQVPQAKTWNILDSTKATCFITCPRKFFYEYILGWKPDFPSNHLIFGSSVHLALEHLLIKGYEYEEVLAAYDLFIQDYRKTYGPETDSLYAPKTPENFFHTLSAYSKMWCADHETYEVLYTEIGGSVCISEEAEVFFKMDSLLKNRNTGKYLSLDHKTASSFYNWSDQFHLSLQTGTYTHVLNCLYPPEEVYGVVYNGIQMAKSIKGWEQISNGKNLTVKSPIDFMRVPIQKNREQMNDWMILMNRIFRDIQMEFGLLSASSVDTRCLMAFPKRPVACNSYGRLCDYHDFCLSWQNPIKRSQEAPIGFIVSHWDPTEEPVKETFNL